MMTGVILDTGTPIIELKVRGSREELMVEGILDTGFNGFLCLPIALAVPLGLELIDVITSELADGTIVEDELVFAGQLGRTWVRHDNAGRPYYQHWQVVGRLRLGRVHPTMA